MTDLIVADLTVVEGRTPVGERLRKTVEMTQELDVLAAQCHIVVVVLNLMLVNRETLDQILIDRVKSHLHERKLRD